MATDDHGRFAPELRAAIKRSGLTLTVISQRLRARNRPVSVATLSNWQSGRSLPGGDQSLGVVAALEELLGRPPDSLADLVGGPRLQGRAVQEMSFVGRPSSREVFQEALEALGFASAQQYAHERVIHQLAIIDSTQSVQRFEHRITVRALESGTCRLPAVHVLGQNEPNIAPRYIATEGCTIGRRVAWPRRRAYGVEFLLDGRLDAGQVATFAYRVEMHASATDVTGSMYSVPRPANDVLLEVEFRGPRRPLDCERYRRTDAGETVSSLRLDHRDRLQISEARFGPGTFGLRWSWGADDGFDDELDDLY